jgi:hypothetical protein
MALGDVKYIVARGFQSHLGWHVMGELAPKEAAEWHNVMSIVAAGYLIPYTYETGYDRLPPHVFSAVVTLQEAKGLIAKGDAPMALDWEPAPELVEAQQVIEAEKASAERNREEAQERAVKQIAELRNNEVDPRPVLVPDKTVLVDAKRREAEKAAGSDRREEYEDWNKDRLVEEINLRNEEDDTTDRMPVGGTKGDLVQRLVEYDLTSARTQRKAARKTSEPKKKETDSDREEAVKEG